MVRKFFEDPQKQLDLELRVGLMRQKIADLYPEYDPDLHDETIEAMVRSEIVLYGYEYLVANNLEPSEAYFRLLENERKNAFNLRRELETSLGTMRSVKRDGHAPTVNIQMINKSVYNIVNTLHEMADALPPEKREELMAKLKLVSSDAVTP